MGDGQGSVKQAVRSQVTSEKQLNATGRISQGELCMSLNLKSEMNRLVSNIFLT